MTNEATAVPEFPPFDLWAACPKCGILPGLGEKRMFQYHDSREADSRGNVCDLAGATEHFHRTCVWCGAQWIEAVTGEPGLTGAEIAELRQLLKQARAIGQGQ